MKECRILKEDRDLLAVYKPAGLAVQSARIGQMDLYHKMLNEMAAKGEKCPELFVINRLDQPVEGIVIFARTSKAAAVLSGQLQQGRIRKIYQAVVCGQPKDEDTLEDELLKDGRANCSRVVCPGTKDAKKALLSYRCLERLPENRARLQICLQTGRHHQIRVQLSHAGFPILGDRKYGDPQDGADHLHLCCCEMHFRHPTGGKPVDLVL